MILKTWGEVHNRHVFLSFIRRETQNYIIMKVFLYALTFRENTKRFFCILSFPPEL